MLNRAVTTGFLRDLKSTGHDSATLCVFKIIALSCVLKIRPDITFTFKHVKYFAAFRIKLRKQHTVRSNSVI